MDSLTIFLCSLITIGTFLFMEAVAWFTHKYVMHGFLWIWHRSHHQVHNHALERNDLFALVFSIPSITLFVISNQFIRVPIFFLSGLVFYVTVSST